MRHRILALALLLLVSTAGSAEQHIGVKQNATIRMNCSQDVTFTRYFPLLWEDVVSIQSKPPVCGAISRDGWYQPMPDALRVTIDRNFPAGSEVCIGPANNDKLSKQCITARELRELLNGRKP